MTDIEIPVDLLPADGRFGSGPSKVRPQVVAALAERAPLGTSHRKPAVRDLVARIRRGMDELFSLPDDYEVVLGNGGATAFWDVATFCLIERRSAHAAFGEFSSKFAAAVRTAPFLAEPVVIEADYGSYPGTPSGEGVDAVALTHNETSTGVLAPLSRPDGGGLVLVDATSAAGAVEVDPAVFDAYYFSPQKAFAAEGGLWVALLSPQALTRVGALRAGGRGVPPSLDLSLALANAAQDQTYNTPAIASLFLLADSVEWLLGRGGLTTVAAECRTKADTIYGWAQERAWASPFVADAALRSPTVCTIDLDADTADADQVSGVLRANGILDTEAYRKLGRNQLRLATFPAVDQADLDALLACIDHVVERLA